MTEHYVSIDLDDERAGKVAEVLGNKTCKKILSMIAEKEMSQSELSESLKMPLNTLDYNIKKLVDGGFIEPVKGFLWSVKGKKIVKYKAVNKRIIIMPRFGLKGIIPALIISGVVALGIDSWINNISYAASSVQAPDVLQKTMSAGSELVQGVASSADAGNVANVALNVSSNIGSGGLWFMLGVLFVMLVLIIWNWRRIW